MEPVRRIRKMSKVCSRVLSSSYWKIKSPHITPECNQIRQQESIPVGCVPPTFRILGSLPTETPSWTEIPWTETPWTET